MGTINNQFSALRAGFPGGNTHPELSREIQKIHDEAGQMPGIPEDRKALDQLNKVRTIKGSISQFSGEESSSACTSCAQCALVRVLSLGAAQDIQPSEIDQIVKDGKENYDLLIGNAQFQAENLAVDGESVPNFQSLSHPDSADIYGFQPYGIAQQKYLEHAEGSTRNFFEVELRNLDEVCAVVGNVGGVIHSQGKTFAIAILDQGLYREYVLFDSHGCEALNGSEEAFVTVTQSREEMARVLSLLCPYKRTERHVEGEEPIPEAFAVEMDKENNPYILYIVTLPIEERKLPAASYEEEGEGPPPPEGLEKESSNRPAIDLHSSFGGAELRERKLRTFFALSLMSIITTSYAYRKGLSEFLVTYIPPRPRPISNTVIAINPKV